MKYKEYGRKKKKRMEVWEFFADDQSGIVAFS